MPTDKPETTTALPRQSGRWWLAAIVRSVISIAILGASVAAMLMIGRGTPPQRPPVDDAQPPVEVQRVLAHAGGIDFEVDGVVIPFREVEVPAQIKGQIAYKSENCRVGHTVRPGELLVRIDPQEYELEVRRLGENVKQAQANLQELEVQISACKRQIELAQEDLVIKQREVARYEGIDDPGVYSKSELDAARLKELQARNALQTERDQQELLEASRNRLESAIDLGNAQLERAKLDLARTEITAPIAGIITREGPEEGGYVPQGGMIVAVQDTSQMEIRCSLPMRQMNWLWQRNDSAGDPIVSDNVYQLPETPATVSFDLDAATCKWEGKLAYFDGGSVDQQTRMVPCRIVVDRPKDVEIVGEVGPAFQSAPITLLSGMFVTVKLHASPGIPLLQIPERAVQPGNHIWTVKPHAGPARTAKQTTSLSAVAASDQRLGTLHKQQINVAHSTDEMVLSYPFGSDLKAGDLVVISPLTAPTENAIVEIMESK